MATTTVTLKIDVDDDGYHQTTTRKVANLTIDLDKVNRILEDTADELRGQSQLPLDAGDADPSHVTPLHPVPDGDEQDVLDEHDADDYDPCTCIVTGPDEASTPDPACPLHGDPDDAS